MIVGASSNVVHTCRTLSAVFTQAEQFPEKCDNDKIFHATEWDVADGFNYRSLRFDHRNRHGQMSFVSLIIDAIEPLR